MLGFKPKYKTVTPLSDWVTDRKSEGGTSPLKNKIKTWRKELKKVLFISDSFIKSIATLFSLNHRYFIQAPQYNMKSVKFLFLPPEVSGNEWVWGRGIIIYYIWT